MSRPVQGEMHFAVDRETGLAQWREQRRDRVRQLARKLGLPLGCNVEVWLRGEIRLTGVLEMREEELLVPEMGTPRLELMVDHVSFRPDELVSCVALE